MLLARRNDVLTRDRLIRARWSWGQLNEPVLTQAFHFGADGRVEVYRNDNERDWVLEDGLLRIFNVQGALTWAFEIVFLAEDRLTLIAQYQNDRHWQPFFCLVEQGGEAVTAPAPAGEGIRLVIWDLDDTFWRGTLSEGEVTPLPETILAVKTLNERGIISAICSKNHFEPARNLLRNIGVWDEFVFPEIAFAPKGAMVQRIIENVQLRPETVLFIDDNVTNLNEAKYYTPGLSVAEPDVIATLLTDPRFAGKPDPEKTRLARYRILESKAVEKAGAGDNETFLRASGIRVSFHTDIEAEFPRIHDLVNRTNQLNFTKRRWPEDEAAALARFKAEQALNFNSHGGYVKVSDRYGQYGICGYYFIIGETGLHFLFSCRAMNMGVEQFVWSRLKKPKFEIQGDVISNLDMPVNWITVVPDADVATAPDAVAKTTICIRGACDMAMTSNFLRTKAETLEELTYGWDGWEITTLPRIVALHEEMADPRNQAIVAQLPGMPAGRFDSDVITGKSDAYVLSFSQESFHGLYRAKSTGMILPMGHFDIGHMKTVKEDYTALAFAQIEANGIVGITAAQWEFFQSEFEFLGGFDEALFTADLNNVFGRLRSHGKPVVILGLNETTGTDFYILDFFANINRIVRPLAEAAGFAYVDVNQFVRTNDDLAPDEVFGGAHFARHVYAKIAEMILVRLEAE